MDLSLAEKQLNAYLDRASAKSGEARAGQDAANAEEARRRAADARHRDALRLVHARGWAEYFAGRALASHDAAARYAQRRDEMRELVRKLESTHKEEKRTA